MFPWTRETEKSLRDLLGRLGDVLDSSVLLGKPRAAVQTRNPLFGVTPEGTRLDVPVVIVMGTQH